MLEQAVHTQTQTQGWMPALLSRAVDVAAALLFSYVLWRMFFHQNEFFQFFGLAAGATGAAAALLHRRGIRTPIDVPVLIYLALCVLSTLVNAARFEPPPHATVWTPAILTACLVVYFFGLAAWLGERTRLAVLAIAIVAAIAGIGVASVYDYFSSSVAWRRMGAYPSVGQWSGYPQLGLLFSIAFPLPLAMVVAGRRRTAVIAAAILALVFALDLIVVNSRSALVVVAGIYVGFAVVEVVRFRRWRLALFGGAPAMCLVALMMTDTGVGGGMRYWFQTRLYLQYITASGWSESPGSGFGRFAIWKYAGEVIGNNPWLGVGPGKYSAAFREKFAGRDLPGGTDAHAHNSTVHIATETGIPSALAFVAIWLLMFKALARAWLSDRNLVLVAGITGALLTYFLRSFSDHFPASSLITSVRVSFLMWTLLAMGAAAVRLSTRQRPAAHA